MICLFNMGKEKAQKSSETVNRDTIRIIVEIKRVNCQGKLYNMYPMYKIKDLTMCEIRNTIT